MKHQTLREIAKFGAGLVLGDFLILLWASTQDVEPVNFLGMIITPNGVTPALIFDAALFFFLIHYGWNLGKIPHLRERSYFLIAGVIFGVVAVLHLWRIVFGLDLTLGDLLIPSWLSWVGVLATVYLFYMSMRMVMHTSKK